MRFLDKYAGRDKRLLSLERELQRLHHAQSHAPIIPLERPYQRGWVKSYVLEDRIARLADTSMFRAVLKEINAEVYSRSRDFVDRFGHAIVLRPKILRPHEWQKLAWPAKHRRLFAYGSWRIDRNPAVPLKLRVHIVGFKLVHTGWIQEQIQPNLITHQRVELPEVRSRIAEIDAYFEATEGHYRLGWLRGLRRNRWRCPAVAGLRSDASLQDHFPPFTPD